MQPPSSSLSSPPPLSVPVFVGSANLGNACPDLASLAAWIPKDGRIDDCCVCGGDDDTQRYQYQQQQQQQRQFAVIALGMQEATWSHSSRNLLQNNSNVSNNNNSSNGEAEKKAESMKVSGSIKKSPVRNDNDPPPPSPPNEPILEDKSDGMYPFDEEGKENDMEEDNNLNITILGIGDESREEDKDPNDGTTGEKMPSIGGGLTGGKVKTPFLRKITKPLRKIARSARTLTTSHDYIKNNTMREPLPPYPPPHSLDPLTLPPSQLLDAVSASTWDLGTLALHQMLNQHLPSYQRLVSYQRGEMRLEIYALTSLVYQNQHNHNRNHKQQEQQSGHVQVVHVSAHNTGRGGLANKGGIAAVLRLYQTRMAFVTCHLEAHEGRAKYEVRCQTMTEILHGTQDTRFLDVSMSSAICFVLGDLNFRTELNDHEYTTAEEHNERVRDLVAAQNWSRLNQADELQRALRNQDCLVGFHTWPCLFHPTFKVERAVGYQYVNKRRPSYTDRILWKGSNIQPFLYEPIEEFATSDHKPIRGAFWVPIQPKLRMRPRMSRFTASAKRRSSLRKQSASQWLKKVSSFKRSASRRSSTAMVAHKNKLYLFVSQMQCHITSSNEDHNLNHPHKNNNNLLVSSPHEPNPFLMLVTTPEAPLKRKVRFWEKFKSQVCQIHTSSRKNPDGSSLLLSHGWPRSIPRRKTLHPSWTADHEEIQCQIQTHTVAGESIDLTGCLLNLTVMDDLSLRTLDPVIGSVQYDLAALMRRCIRSDGLATPSKLQSSAASKSPSSSAVSPSLMVPFSASAASAATSAAASMTHSGVVSPSASATASQSQDQSSMAAALSADVDPSNDEHPQIQSGVPPLDLNSSGHRNRRKSQLVRRSTPLLLMSNLFGGRSTFGTLNTASDVVDSDGDDDPIIFDWIDEPLLKNGRQVGTMRCMIELWWMDQDVPPMTLLAQRRPNKT